MANVNKIEQYNKGTVFPDSYEETYLATNGSLTVEYQEKYLQVL